MKLNKSLVAAVLGLSLTSLCQAGDVFMSGSTAMRSTVYAALINAGTVFQSAPSVTTYNGGGSGANYMAFRGTLVGGSGTTTLYCHWSGSEAGILNVASNTTIQVDFIDASLVDGADHGSALPATTQNAFVNLAMADNSQAYSRTKKPTLATKAAVGVITFEWVRNHGLWTGTNVTDSQVRQALGGYCPRAVFSGNAADVNDYVYVSGRNNQSGTRVNAFGTSGFGIFTIPNQVEMNASGVMQDLNGFGTYAGDYGYESGGTLASTMGANTTTAADLFNGKTGYSVISYMGVGDASSAIGTYGAVPLALNGVPFSSAAIKEGQYGFWGNEYILAANNANTEALAVFNLLSANTGINTFCDGTKAIKLTDMHCTRTGPTSDPSHN